MPTPILFCGDPLRPGRVDGNFVAEAQAVRAAGVAYGLLDHDALLVGDLPAAVRRVPAELGPAWYRGWMIPDFRYEELAVALAERGGGLLVPPADQRRTHNLPGWYDTFAEVTPASVWMPAEPLVVPSREELAALVAPLGAGPGIVKDYVKSRKHDWHDACYIPDLTDLDAVHRVLRRFVELQHLTLAGGLVVRAFEPFVTGRGADGGGGDGGGADGGGADGGGADGAGADGPGAGRSRPGEARVWWLDGVPVLVSAHPDTPDQRPEPDLRAIGPLIAELGCRFVTTDLALRSDGVWRLVELGDAQVSALPAGADSTVLVTALLAAPITEPKAPATEPKVAPATAAETQAAPVTQPQGRHGSADPASG